MKNDPAEPASPYSVFLLGENTYGQWALMMHQIVHHQFNFQERHGLILNGVNAYIRNQE